MEDEHVGDLSTPSKSDPLILHLMARSPVDQSAYSRFDLFLLHGDLFSMRVAF